jgi:alkaline phosphatase D
MGRGGADELFANANPGNPQALNVAGARAVELALISGNKNVQFIEWVDHGYGIVDLTPERAIFECWWQDKLTPDSPQVLGMQLVSWAADDAFALPSPRYRDQIDAVTLHGLAVTPTAGERQDAPAPEGVLQAA